jgi:hypothetical protein
MGSFNVTCSISKLSINKGEKVIFFPLIPPSYLHKGFKEKINVKYFSYQQIFYSDDFFSPLCLPIEGTYADYGLVKNIIKNNNTAAIEKFIGLDIQQFTDYVSRFEKIDSVDKQIENLSCNITPMYVHKKVYDSMINSKIFDAYFENFDEIFNNASVDLVTPDKYFIRLFENNFKDWYFFTDIYKQSIIEKKLKQDILDYIKFRCIMYSSNNFFFPGMQGEQFGNIEASKVIADVTAEIINSKN